MQRRINRFSSMRTCSMSDSGMINFFQRSGKKLRILKVPTFEFGE